MANAWGSNPIVLDTANDDSSFLAANDGVKFHTGRFKIKSIHFSGGANTNAVEITGCKIGAAGGSITGALVLETGDLNKQLTFGEGIWVEGLCAKTLGGSTKAIIALA